MISPGRAGSLAIYLYRRRTAFDTQGLEAHLFVADTHRRGAVFLPATRNVQEALFHFLHEHRSTHGRVYGYDLAVGPGNAV